MPALKLEVAIRLWHDSPAHAQELLARRHGPRPDAAGYVAALSASSGAGPAVPERIDQIKGRIRRGESRCRLDRAACRRRNIVERCFNRLKHNKALATRYDKRACHDQALVTLACLRLWLPRPCGHDLVH